MKYRKKIADIRGSLLLGKITYEEALALGAPIVKEINNKASLIAKKYGKKFTKFKIQNLLR